MESNYYSFIYDEEEVKFFFDNILPDLAPTEVYFLSLSARNKYLTQEEREKYDLGRTEMFSKTIVRERDWFKFLRKIRRMECHKDGYLTRTGYSIPEKCIICYVNINPSNILTALHNFKIILGEYEMELASLLLSNRRDTANIVKRLKGLDNNYYSCLQNNRGTKYWIDIDIDTKDGALYNKKSVLDFLESKKLKNYWWIDTKSGYHLLIKRSELTFNPEEIVCFLYKELHSYYDAEIRNSLILESHKDTFFIEKIHNTILSSLEIPLKTPSPELRKKLYGYEIIINKNEMIPLPGTYQGGHKVTILNKPTN